MRKKGIGTGGAIERDLVRRWARRRLVARRRTPEATFGYRDAAADLIAWLDAQPKRTKRPGGLGRR